MSVRELVKDSPTCAVSLKIWFQKIEFDHEVVHATQMLQSAFEDVSIADWELLLQNHLSRVSGPRCSFLDESWC